MNKYVCWKPSRTLRNSFTSTEAGLMLCVSEMNSDHFVLDQTLLDAMVFKITGDLVEPTQERYSKVSEYSSSETKLVPSLLTE